MYINRNIFYALDVFAYREKWTDFENNFHLV